MALPGLISSFHSLCWGASVFQQQVTSKTHIAAQKLLWNPLKNNSSSNTALWMHHVLKDRQSRAHTHPFQSPGSRFNAAVRIWFYAERLFNVLCMDQQLQCWPHCRTPGHTQHKRMGRYSEHLLRLMSFSDNMDRGGINELCLQLCTISHCCVLLQEKGTKKCNYIQSASCAGTCRVQL